MAPQTLGPALFNGQFPGWPSHPLISLHVLLPPALLKHMKLQHKMHLTELTIRILTPLSLFIVDSFAHRSAVRTALANDKEWQEKYLSPMLTCLDKQENEIAYLVPWCELGNPTKEGVYELVTFQMKPGGPAVWGQAFKAAIKAHINTGYTKLIGVFHTEYGFLNTVNVLWWNEDPDSRAAGRHYAHEDPRVVAAVRESVQFLESQRNMLLIPTSFSPLK
uniref:NIPSNAP domain-containing protein n=2 Tax=Sphenodon punctatus TaxID=8508 RepID=A0A8D0GWJ0_SPHPU